MAVVVVVVDRAVVVVVDRAVVVVVDRATVDSTVARTDPDDGEFLFGFNEVGVFVV